MESNQDKNYSFYGMGFECFQHKEFEKALMYFRMSVKLDEHSRTYARIYDCLINLRKFKEARPYIEIAYNLNKNHDKVGMQYVTKLVKEDKITEAISI